MNLREGIRRSALLLGALGAIICGFVAYVELRSFLEQRVLHNKFEQLANSEVVKQERKCYLEGSSSGCSQSHWPKGSYTIGQTEPESDVNKGGIKTIFWTHDQRFAVEEFVTEDGQALFPTPAPSEWLLPLIAFIPVLGFIIPWGTVRAIGWVAIGFVQPMK